MNVYDFDGTIYRGDSTIDFWLFSISKDPLLIRYLPNAAAGFLLYKLGRISRTEFKERFFSFLKGIRDPEKKVRMFYEKKRGRIKKWYIERKKESDVIISASPEFLLSAFCEELDVYLIASEVDIRSGRFIGPNCRGEEKVRRFRSMFGDVSPDEFYSDSYSDAPMAEISKKAFYVKNEKIMQWKKVK